MDLEFEQYQNDLAEVLRSEDKERILFFLKQRHIPTPSDDLSFWGAVHKMRLCLPAFTEQEKDFSRVWLSEHGMMTTPPVPDNLQKHMAMFAVKLAAAAERGLDEDVAALTAASEANRLYPLTPADVEALRAAGTAHGASRASAANN